MPGDNQGAASLPLPHLSPETYSVQALLVILIDEIRALRVAIEHRKGK